MLTRFLGSNLRHMGGVSLFLGGAPLLVGLKRKQKGSQKETNHLWGLLILRQAHIRGMIRTPSHLPSHVIWVFLKNLGANSSWIPPGGFLLVPVETIRRGLRFRFRVQALLAFGGPVARGGIWLGAG